MIVRFLPRARQRIRTIARWWRRNRPAVPTLFDDELADVVEKLRADPVLGVEYRVVDSEMIRRTLLKKSGQHVYYSINETNGIVVIHSVWGARRGRGPKL